MTEHKNDTSNVPAAACRRCGGWTTQGGMSQHGTSNVPVMGRTGCDCHNTLKAPEPYPRRVKW